MTLRLEHCHAGCVADQECAECHRTKAPTGRSVPMEMMAGMCTDACPGYDKDPKPGHLWPEEWPPELGDPDSNE